MVDREVQSREDLAELRRSKTPLYLQGGDPDNPNDPLNDQPMNIPAIVVNHLRALDSEDTHPMRSFTIKIEEHDHTRLVLLADALGTPKTTLARELLQMATMEAVGSLPEDIAEDLRRKFLESV